MERQDTMDFIDLRSDTGTWPTLKMREAILACKFGYDAYSDDPKVVELEILAAEMLDKEAALFVPSGTFGNQISVMSHTTRGDEVIAGEDSYIVQYEIGALAVIAGINLKAVKSVQGTLDIVEVETKIRNNEDNTSHYPTTGLICVENAHSNGKVISLENMEAIYKLARRHNIPVHLDGARLFNASTYLKVDAKEITKYCDSVTFCLSKGLCSPIGSIVCGTKDFIMKVKKNRKLLGGGSKQVGMLAAPGLISLREMITPLADDHRITQNLAQELSKFSQIRINPSDAHINLIFFTVDEVRLVNEDIIQHMLKNGIKIRVPKKGGKWRFVVNHYIREKEVEKIISAFKEYFDSL